MLKVAIYCRCSTAEQSVAVQLEGLREYAQVRRFEVVAEYLDEGVSGAKARRPALDRLLADAHRRRFDAVLCWKLDRLGRSLVHLLRLVEQFEALGVDLVSLGDPGLDTTSPHGRLVFSMLGAVAEFERSLIVERTRAGVAAARRRGKKLGRPRARVDLAHAQELLERGEPLAAVAKRFGVARSTLRERLAEWRKSSPRERAASAVIPALQ
jgi:DNA invertase Pin-like site-specific DNA recombinase